MGYLFSWAVLSKAATERWLDTSEATILICGLVLAVGAAGEYIEEHGTLPRWMKWSRQPKMVFVWMVALSLIGEFVADAGVFVFSGHLQTINDGEVAALNKEAGEARRDSGNANREAGLARKDAADANKDAGEVKERAGKLEVQAATLRKQVEDERLERVRLEAIVAPRLLPHARSLEGTACWSRHMRKTARALLLGAK